MELSVNYSEELAELIRAGEVRVDRIKCADWPDMIATARQLGRVYVHFPLHAGTDGGQPADYPRADAMARDTGTQYVNLHLATLRTDFPDHGPDDPMPTGKVIDKMLVDIGRAATALGSGRLILENVPYYGPGTDFRPECVDPAVISTVVRQSGCGLLLDLSHARLAARFLGVDAKKYIEQLPFDRLTELHITGIREVDGRLRDHMPLGDEDWDWVRYAIDRIRNGGWRTPWSVAFEYGGIGETFKWRSEKNVLAEQVPRLWELIHPAL